MDNERIPRGLATGLASECNNKKLLTLDSLRFCRREDPYIHRFLALLFLPGIFLGLVFVFDRRLLIRFILFYRSLFAGRLRYFH